MTTTPRRGERLATVTYCSTATRDRGTAQTTLRHQETKVRLFAAEHGYRVGTVYTDSGGNRDGLTRPLDHLTHPATEETIHAVCILRRDRLSHNHTLRIAAEEAIAKTGIPLLVCEEPSEATRRLERLTDLLHAEQHHVGSVRGRRRPA